MIYEIIWLLIFPGMILHWYCTIKNHRTLVYSGKELIKNVKITFLLATKSCPSLVQDSVDSIHTSCHLANYSNYDVIVVTQKDESCIIKNAKMIHVPSTYTCKSKYKAKDLNYSLQFTPDNPNEWIFHLDEDSQITEQTVNALHHYINSGGNPIANGLSVFISNGNVFTFYSEAHRMWTFPFLKELLKSTPLWMNGSNMLVRSDIEHEIGWNFGNVFGEDTSFAYHARKYKGKIFGWHGGLTIEQPCKNVKELLKQRKRWFTSAITFYNDLPKEAKYLRLYCVFSWISGFLLTTFYFLKWFGLYNIHPLFASLFSITVILWYGRFQLGLYYMFKYNNQKIEKLDKSVYYVGLIFLTPLIELLCTYPTILALTNPPKTFEVTEK